MKSRDMRTVKKLQDKLPSRIAGIYLVFGMLYGVITEPLTRLLTVSEHAMLILEFFKELAFLLASAFLIYYLLRREVGGRLEIESALAKSEKKFRELYETTRDGVASLSLEGKIIEFNPAFQGMLGYTSEEILQKTYQDITPVKWHAPQKSIIETQLLTRGWTDLHEQECERPDGTVFPIELRAYLVRDDKGRPDCYWAIVRDISAGKQAQEELRIQTERFQLLSENAPFGMAMIRQDGSFQYVNPKFEQIFGYDLEDVPSGREWFRKAFPDHTHRDEATAAWKEDLEGLAPDEMSSRVFTVTCKDNSQKIIHFGAVRLGAGEHLVTCQDITDRKRAEAALEETERRYRTLAETARDIIWTVNLDLKYTYISPSVTATLGYTVEEILGTRSMNILTPASIERVTKAFAEEMQQEIQHPRERFVSRSEEIEVYHKDGSTRWKEITTTFLRDQDGRPTGILGISRDINDRKKMEAELREARDNLERRVEERTAELSAANQKLRQEMAARINAEESLRINEERLRAIVETASDYIFIKDRSLRYTFVNPAFEKLVGLPIESILGNTDEQIFGLEVSDHSSYLESRVLGGETVEEEHTKIVHGNPMTFLDILAPMHNHQADIIGICGISRNVTERKALRDISSTTKREYISESMVSVLAQSALAATADSLVLLTGESGSGKDYLARYIHDHSKRSSGPFYAINCAAIHPGLAESELFGHEAGAFTGTTGRKRGMLELAEGGTILLNEIGELSLSVQAKLLTFLDTRSFTRVGGEKIVTVDARLIAATNKDLMQEVANGRFRRDLLYRLQVFPLQAPPLRNRREDIPILAEQLLSKLAHKGGLHGHGSVDASAMQRLINYDWPGNVRELRNVLERAMILSKGRNIRAHHLSLEGALKDPKDLSSNFPLPEPLDAILGNIERSLIEKALLQSRSNQRAAASLLGISRYALARHMKKLGINLSEGPQTP